MDNTTMALIGGLIIMIIISILQTRSKNKTISDLEDTNETLELSETTLKSDKNILQGKVSSLKKEKANIATAADNFASDLKDAETLARDTQKKHQKELDLKQSLLEKAQSRASGLDVENKKLTGSNGELTQRIKDKNTRINSLQVNVTRANTRCQKLQDEVNVLNAHKKAAPTPEVFKKKAVEAKKTPTKRKIIKKVAK